MPTAKLSMSESGRMGVRTATEPTWHSTETDTLECSGRSSAADPGCLSQILIFIHPGSRIPDPTKAPKGGKFVFVLPFFVATNILEL
jgi:hypothetical protein